MFYLAVPLAAGVLSALPAKRGEMEAINLAAFGLTFLLAVAVAAAGPCVPGHLALGRIPLCRFTQRAGDSADALRSPWCARSMPSAISARTSAAGRWTRRAAAGSRWRSCANTTRSRRCLCSRCCWSPWRITWASCGWPSKLTTLASVFLVTFYGKVTSLEAAWKYAIIGGVGLSMALFGTIITYYAGHKLPGSEGLSGLNWSVLVGQAAQLDKTSMRLAFILVLLGYGTKAGLAPMHTWKPDAYSEAPVPSAAILSTALLNCAVYGLVRFYVLAKRCLGAEFPGNLLLLFGILSMGISVPFVLVQRNFRRLLAYSTIDQAGIMVTALGFGGKFGRAGPDAAHDVSHHGQVAAVPLRRQCLSAVSHGPVPPDQGRRHRSDASDRRIAFFMASAGDRGDAAVQPVSERIPDGRRGLAGGHSRAGRALRPVRHRSLRGIARCTSAGWCWDRHAEVAHRLVPVAGFGAFWRWPPCWSCSPSGCPGRCSTDPRRRPHRGGRVGMDARPGTA